MRSVPETKKETHVRAHAAFLFLGASTVWFLIADDGSDLQALALWCLSPGLSGILGCHLVHLSGLHLAANLVVVVAGGTMLESRWGTARFFAFYLLAVVGVSTVSIGVGLLAVHCGLVRGAEPVALGASGLALACLTALAVTARDNDVMWRFQSRYLFWTLILLGAAGLMVIDGQRAFAVDGAAAKLFLAPQLSGVAFALVFLSIEPWVAARLETWRERRRSRRLEVVGQIRHRVDELLRKISVHGYESLTPDEKIFLQSASRHFKRDA